MKTPLFLFVFFLWTTALCAQDADTLTKKKIIQIGYITESGASNGAVLRGIEFQSKFLFGKHRLVKGDRLIATYFDVGYSYFAASDYSLGQLNAGLGITYPLFFINMDVGLGAVGYHGQVYEESFIGKKIDFGGYIGAHIPFGREGGIYIKLWSPGGITMLSNNSYSSPNFLSVGFQL
jgi:hypothetical protein